jgi:hypothetical protein
MNKSVVAICILFAEPAVVVPDDCFVANANSRSVVANETNWTVWIGLTETTGDDLIDADQLVADHVTWAVVVFNAVLFTGVAFAVKETDAFAGPTVADKRASAVFISDAELIGWSCESCKRRNNVDWIIVVAAKSVGAFT